VSDYYLVIDTEASGLPQQWSLPYSADDNWPHAVQVSWLLYGPQKQLIKKADYYIRRKNIAIASSALAIHGITPEFLASNGAELGDVLDELAADINKYTPLIVGHFIRLDYYILSAEFYRLGKANPLAQSAVFCTMQTSMQLHWNTMARQLHLNELYRLLFNREMQNPHNAFYDAEATAGCFFELLKEGEITERTLLEQNKDSQSWRDPTAIKSSGCMPVVLLILLGSLLIYLTIL
jgi:DNA polymerase III subunit epsilon